MQPEAIRRQICEEHREIRTMLEGIEDLARRFEKGDSGVGTLLREQALELYEKLRVHIDHEDELLTPLLRSLGEDGARHAQHLDHEHHEQRELLKYLTSRLIAQSLPTILVARELQNFAVYVRLDMEHEEETMLQPLAPEARD